MFYLCKRKEYSELSFVVADFTVVFRATFFIYAAGQGWEHFLLFSILYLNDVDNSQ